jgi:hypothetical protein
LPVISTDVLGEETWTVNAHPLHIGAPDELTGQAMGTLTAIDVRIDRYALSWAESGNFGANLVDLADCLVTGYQRIGADKSAVM